MAGQSRGINQITGFTFY